MKSSNNSIHDPQEPKPTVLSHLKNEKGHMLALEWSYLLVIFIILLSILLPDIVNIGRTMMDTHGASSYAIQRTAEQGHMNNEIANDVVEYLEDRDYQNFEVHGTGTLTGMRDDDPIVTVKVVNSYAPRILSVIPDMRVSSTIEMEDGIIKITSVRQDMSNVFVRSD